MSSGGTARATLAPKPSQQPRLQRKCDCGAKAGSEGTCEECSKERLQRKANGTSGPDRVPPIVHEVLRSPGQPLDDQTRSFMEPRFGQSFGDVRVHADPVAAASARAVNALAYTVGRDIAFDVGSYAPSTANGRRLLAHELAHVVQQSRGGLDEPALCHEIDANYAAETVATTSQPVRVLTAAAVGVARQDPRHARGYAGEQGMGFELFDQREGWLIVEGPSGSAGHGVTTSGFDAIGYHPQRDILQIPDNKSMKATGNVSSATAIDPARNLGKNFDAAIQRVAAMQDFKERARILELLRAARDANRNGALPGSPAWPKQVELVVTGIGGQKTGVTSNLASRGIQFRPASTSSAKLGTRVPKTPTDVEEGGGKTGLGGALLWGAAELAFHLLLSYLAAKVQQKLDENRMAEKWKNKAPKLEKDLTALSAKIGELRRDHPNAPLYANVSIEYQYQMVTAAGPPFTEQFWDFGAVSVDVDTQKIEGSHLADPIGYFGFWITPRIVNVAWDLKIPTEAEREKAKQEQKQREINEYFVKSAQQAKPTKMEDEDPYSPSPKERKQKPSPYPLKVRPKPPDMPGLIPSSPPQPPPVFLPPPQDEPLTLLPGAPTDPRARQAAEDVKNLRSEAKRLRGMGIALRARLDSKDDRPSPDELKSFMGLIKDWEKVTEGKALQFQNESNPDASEKLRRLVGTFGPQLTELRTHLGG